MLRYFFLSLSVLIVSACLNPNTLAPTTAPDPERAVIVFSVSKFSESAEIMADHGPYVWFCRAEPENSALIEHVAHSRLDGDDLGPGYKVLSILPGIWSYSHFGIGWGGQHASFRQDQVFWFKVEPQEVIYLGNFHFDVATDAEFETRQPARTLTYEDGSKLEVFDPQAMFEVESRFAEAKVWLSETYPSLSDHLQERLPTMGAYKTVWLHSYLMGSSWGRAEWKCP